MTDTTFNTAEKVTVTLAEQDDAGNTFPFAGPVSWEEDAAAASLTIADDTYSAVLAGQSVGTTTVTITDTANGLSTQVVATVVEPPPTPNALVATVSEPTPQ